MQSRSLPLPKHYTFLLFTLLVEEHVVEVLEKEGSLALGNTFQLLMNLMVFFDCCHDQHWEVGLFECHSCVSVCAFLSFLNLVHILS